MLDNIALNLDYCRMLLAKPTNDPDTGLGDQYETMELVKTAFYNAISGDMLRSTRAGVDCNKIILDDEAASSFDKLCARVIFCASVSNFSLHNTPPLFQSLKPGG